MRQLRTIINQAIAGGLMAMEKYPFKKYEIPAGRNIKKALTETDISRLLKYAPTKPDEQKALDFWILSYLCNGMNFADIIAFDEDFEGLMPHSGTIIQLEKNKYLLFNSCRYPCVDFDNVTAIPFPSNFLLIATRRST